MFEGHTAPVKYVRLLPDGKRLLSVGDDRTVRVWDPVAGEGGGLIKTLEFTDQPHSIEITPTGDRFVMALGKKVQVWSTHSYEMIKVCVFSISETVLHVTYVICQWSIALNDQCSLTLTFTAVICFTEPN